MGVQVKERPKGSGTWWVFINHQGRRKAKKIGRDKKTAVEVAKKIEARLVLQQYGLDSEKETEIIPTLKQYVEGWKGADGDLHIGWMDKYARLALKRSTYHTYHHALRGHLIPEFGETPINEITSRKIGDFVVKKFNQDLRSQSIKNLKNCLSSILRYAKTPDGYIETNPARGIMVPIPEDERASRIPDPLSWEDREILEGAFRQYTPRYYPLVLAGFRTGLRIGELIALQWGDIDFHHRLMLVQRNVTRNRITTPKSKSSVRQVRMTAHLVAELQDLRLRQKEEKLKKGWGDLPEWVFCNESGDYVNYYHFVNRVWNRTMEKSGLRRRTPHDMRHTYATLRLSKGDSLAEVSKEMGLAPRKLPTGPITNGCQRRAEAT
ncbi:MAG: site-specific integrase [Pseudomonadota bacterium]